MRRLALFVAVVGTLVAGAAMPASAASDLVLRFRFSGTGAEGLWTTCPFEATNVVCTDTFVFVAEEVAQEDSSTFEGTTLFIDQFRYKIDRRGSFTFLDFTFGFGEALLSVGRNLSSATASAVVDLVTCTDRRCADAGTATIEGSWTGEGDLVRVNGTFHEHSKGFTLNSHFNGSFRDASASLLVDGADVGTQLFADVFNFRSADVFVCHGSC